VIVFPWKQISLCSHEEIQKNAVEKVEHKRKYKDRASRIFWVFHHPQDRQKEEEHSKEGGARKNRISAHFSFSRRPTGVSNNV
jgi:N-acetyl-anhydromuramyl-L-alanine amidase AmpD